MQLAGNKVQRTIARFPADVARLLHNDPRYRFLMTRSGRVYMFWGMLSAFVLPGIILALTGLLYFHFRFWPSYTQSLDKLREAKGVTLGDLAPIANKEPGIHFGGVNLEVKDGRVRVWSTITLLDKNGKESYVEGISLDDFEVQETVNDKARKAHLLDLYHNEVPRSVKAVLMIDTSGSMGENSGVTSPSARKTGSLGIAVKAPNILCHRCAKAS